MGALLGNSKLRREIRRRHPRLRDEEVSIVVDKVQEVTARHLRRGEHLSFVKENRDGTWDLTVYGLEIVDKATARKRKK